MAEKTSIQWTDHTFNPFRGCVKVSPGCKFCYAERQAKRNPTVLGEWGPEGTRVLAAQAQWRAVQRWNDEAAELGQRHNVFCASIADVFEAWPGQMTDSQGRLLWGGAQHEHNNGIPYTLNLARERLWQLIRRCPNLIFQLLTKRPENIGRMMPAGRWDNVWLGTSVENQEYTWRIDALKEAPQDVPVRFISAEPLLDRLELWQQLDGIQWVIIGGESGGEARPFRLAWARSLITQCRDYGVACFMKQTGKVAEDTVLRDNTPGVFRGWRLPLVNDPGHGGDPADWPEDICVREFPR